MGHPGYTVDGGEVIFKGQDVLALEVDERARLGMFLALQYPVVVPGISMTNFLRTALNAKARIRRQGQVEADFPQGVPLDAQGPARGSAHGRLVPAALYHDGFSGGEKKRAEILADGNAEAGDRDPG